MVEDKAKVERMCQETIAVVGDLAELDTGLLVVLPVNLAEEMEKNINNLQK